MSTVGQMTVEDATKHGKKSLKEIDRMIKGIEEDIGEPVSVIIIMSAQQFNRINMLLKGSEVFVDKVRNIAGLLQTTTTLEGWSMDDIRACVRELVSLVTGGDRPRPGDEKTRPPEPGELG